jgi:hypothetical protein
MEFEVVFYSLGLVPGSFVDWDAFAGVAGEAII